MRSTFVEESQVGVRFKTLKNLLLSFVVEKIDKVNKSFDKNFMVLGLGIWINRILYEF